MVKPHKYPLDLILFYPSFPPRRPQIPILPSSNRNHGLLIQLAKSFALTTSAFTTSAFSIASNHLEGGGEHQCDRGHPGGHRGDLEHGFADGISTGQCLG